MKRVVITGVGVIGPTARGFDAFVEALEQGKSGGRTISVFDAAALPTRIAAEVTDFDAAEPFDELRGRGLGIDIPDWPAEDRKTAFGVASALDCAEDADIEDWSDQPLSLHLGTGLSSVTPEELKADMLPFMDEDGWFDPVAFGEALGEISSPAPWRHVTDEVNRLVLAALGAEGPSTSNFSACAASLQALGRAYRDIQAGRTRRAMAGGMDSMLHPFGMISFIRLGALTTRNDRPEAASRPFDKTRDGFLIGEGGAVLLLEELEAARQRGAKIYAEIIGYGTSIDAHKVTAPHPEGKGAYLAMKRAMEDANIDPAEINYINAHGTGTPLNDSTESRAIRQVWPRDGGTPAVSSTKSMTGHLIAAAGAIEAVACVAALREGFLPPSINIGALDPECDVEVVDADRGQMADVRIAMNNSFGFGGQNGSLIIKRWDGA